jgi:hypothetical protein
MKAVFQHKKIKLKRSQGESFSISNQDLTFLPTLQHVISSPSSTHESRGLSRESLQHPTGSLLEVCTRLGLSDSTLYCRRIPKSIWFSIQGKYVILHMSDKISLMGTSQWHIGPVANDSDVFTIRPAYDTDLGLVSSEPQKVDDYGFPQGQLGSSANWKITKSADGKYSKYNLRLLAYLALTLSTESSSKILTTF